MNRKLYNFAEIKNQIGNSAELHFYGDIVADSWGKWTSEDKCPSEVREFLDSVKDVENLYVYVNSGGGSVGAGLTIYHMLQRHPGHKIAIIDGISASISSIIPFGCDEVRMYRDCYLMIHKPWTHSSGNANQLRKDADDLDIIESGMMAAYERFKRDDVPAEKIAEMVNNETWLTGTMAAEYFKITIIEDTAASNACASVYYDEYSKMPGEAKALLSRAKEPDPDETAELLMRINLI